MRNKGLCGLAFWDHGQKNQQGADLYKLDPDFYKTDLAYKLKEFEHYLVSCEMQKEAHFQCKYNNSWSDINFYDVPGFKRFLLKNEFWALHLKAYDIDISEFHDHGFYEFSLKEVEEGIRFGFRNFNDTLVLHPGTYNGQLGKAWPDPKDAAYIQGKRSEAFLNSLRSIIGVYCKEAFHMIKYIEGYSRKQAQNINTLTHYFKILSVPDLSEDEFFRCTNEIMKIIRIAQLPVKMVRYAKNPDRDIHLCLENVEPPNFLINTPEQHWHWFQILTELYNEEMKRYTTEKEKLDKFAPKMLIDVNHYLHSKKILTEPGNDKLAFLFPDYNDLHRDFISLPPDYGDEEPLFNMIVRKFSKFTDYYHLAGCYVYDDIMYTHEPVKAIRNHMYMLLNPQGLPVPKYSTAQFHPGFELDLEEVIQVIGCDSDIILEVFNRSSELMKSSMIHTSEYINFLYKEHKRLKNLFKEEIQRRIAGSDKKDAKELSGLESLLDEAELFIYPYHSDEDKWKVGYDYAGFYVQEERPFLIGTINDETGKITLNLSLENESEGLTA